MLVLRKYRLTIQLPVAYSSLWNVGKYPSLPVCWRVLKYQIPTGDSLMKASMPYAGTWRKSDTTAGRSYLVFNTHSLENLIPMFQLKKLPTSMVMPAIHQNLLKLTVNSI